MLKMADERSPLLDTSAEQRESLKVEGDSLDVIADDKRGGEIAREFTEKPTERRCVWGVEPVIFLYFLHSLGGTLTSQQLAYAIVAADFNYTGPVPGQNSPNATCEVIQNQTEDDLLVRVQAEVGFITIVSSLAYIAPAAVALTFLGGVCDTWGRRHVLCISIISSLAKLVVWILVPLLQLNVYVLILAAVFEGLGGGMTGFGVATTSYIADCSSEEKRSFRMMVGSVCMMFGTIISSVTCGFLIQYLGFVYTIVIYIAILAVTLLYILLLLPESLAVRKPYVWCSPQYMRNSINIIRQKDHKHKQVLLLLLLPIAVLPQLVEFGLYGTQTLYLLNAPRCWGPVKLGLFMALGIICTAVGTLTITRALQTRLGDAGLMVLGSIGPVIKYNIIAFAASDIMIFSALIFGSFDVTPMMAKSSASKLVQPNELGALFSVFAWLELTVPLASSAFAAIYRATLAWFSGFVFLVMAAIYITSLALSVALLRIVRKRRTSNSKSN